MRDCTKFIQNRFKTIIILACKFDINSASVKYPMNIHREFREKNLKIVLAFSYNYFQTDLFVYFYLLYHIVLCKFCKKISNAIMVDEEFQYSIA